MKVLRTPNARFADLADYPFAPHYHQITPELRLHYVDEDPRGLPRPQLQAGGAGLPVPRSGTAGQPRVTLRGGRFIQEDDPQTFARLALEACGDNHSA